MPSSHSLPPVVGHTGRPVAAGERSSALILVPTLLLVLLTLGGIAVDLSALFAAQRSVQRTVSAAADDAAGMLDARLVQRTGELRIDAGAARDVVMAHLDTANLPGSLVGPVTVQVGQDGDTIDVEVRVRVERIMLRAFPGVADSEVLTVRATGRLVT